MAQDTELTLFKLPTQPDEIGLQLPVASLRRLNFSALDFPTARRAIIEYITTYFSSSFNDYVAANGGIMMMEVIASEVAKLAMRGDILFNEAFLPTSTTQMAVANHLILIGQAMQQQTPATVDVQASITSPSSTDIRIPAGTSFSLPSSDQNQLIYEIYRAPGDWTSPIVIPAGKAGVIAFGIEGKFTTTSSYISTGGINQTFSISDSNALSDPIIVNVVTGNMTEQWAVVTDSLLLYGPTDKVVQVTFLAGVVTFNFGDNVNGQSLLSGQSVSVTYRSGGGSRGRIGIGQLNQSRQIIPQQLSGAPVNVNFINVNPSIGGVDAESIESAKARAPRTYATHNSLVTASDYAQLASTFNHPVFGSVLKAVAATNSSLNVNLVEIYILALGANGAPAVASIGLKRGLSSFMSSLNSPTIQLSILDATVLPVDIDVTIVVNKNADATVTKNSVEAVIDSFFDLSKWELGQPLYISSLISAIKAVDGVSYVDLFGPSDNILPAAVVPVGTNQIQTVAFNQLIIQGNRSTRYYYESGL